MGLWAHPHLIISNLQLRLGRQVLTEEYFLEEQRNQFIYHGTNGIWELRSRHSRSVG